MTEKELEEKKRQIRLSNNPDLEGGLYKSVPNTIKSNTEGAGFVEDVGKGVIGTLYGEIPGSIGHLVGQGIRGVGGLLDSPMAEEIGEETSKYWLDHFNKNTERFKKLQYNPYTGTKEESTTNFVAGMLAPLPGEFAVAGGKFILGKSMNAARRQLDKVDRAIGKASKTYNEGRAYLATKTAEADAKAASKAGKQVVKESAEQGAIRKAFRADNLRMELGYSAGFTFPETTPDGNLEEPMDTFKRAALNTVLGVGATAVINKGIDRFKKTPTLEGYRDYLREINKEGGGVAPVSEFNAMLKYFSDENTFRDLDMSAFKREDGSYDYNKIKSEVPEGVYYDTSSRTVVVNNEKLGTFSAKRDGEVFNIDTKGGIITRNALSTAFDSGRVISTKQRVHEANMELIDNAKPYTHEDIQTVTPSGNIAKQYEGSLVGQASHARFHKNKESAKLIDTVKTSKVKDGILSYVPRLFDSIKTLASDVLSLGVTDNVPKHFKVFNENVNQILDKLTAQYGNRSRTLNKTEIKQIVEDYALSIPSEKSGLKSVEDEILEEVIDIFFKKNMVNDQAIYTMRPELEALVKRAEAIAVYQKHLELTTKDRIEPSKHKDLSNPDYELKSGETGYFVETGKIAGIMKDLIGVSSKNSKAQNQFEKLSKQIVDKMYEGKPLKVVSETLAKKDGKYTMRTIVDDFNIGINPSYIDKDNAKGFSKYADNKISSEMAYTNTINQQDKIPNEFRTADDVIEAHNKGNLAKIEANVAMHISEDSPMYKLVQNLVNTVYTKNTTQQGKAFAKYLFGGRNSIKGNIESILANPKQPDKGILNKVLGFLGHDIKEWNAKEGSMRELLNDTLREIKQMELLYKNQDMNHMTFDVKMTDLLRPSQEGLFSPQTSHLYMQLFIPQRIDEKGGAKTLVDDIIQKNITKDDVDIIMTNIPLGNKPAFTKPETYLNSIIKKEFNKSIDSFDDLVDNVHSALKMEDLDKSKSYLSVSSMVKKYILDNNGKSRFGIDDEILVWGTSDAKTSNFNNTLAMLGIEESSVALGTQSFSNDVRNQILDAVVKDYGYIKELDGFLDKDTVKPLFNGWFYGGQVDNLTGEEQAFADFIENKIINSYREDGSFFKKIMTEKISGYRTNFLQYLDNAKIDTSKIRKLLNTGATSDAKTKITEEVGEYVLSIKRDIESKIEELNRKMANQEEVPNIEQIRNEIKAKSDLYEKIEEAYQPLEYMLKINEKLSRNAKETSLVNLLKQDEFSFLYSQIKDGFIKDIGNKMDDIISSPKFSDIKLMKDNIEKINMVMQTSFYSKVFEKIYRNDINIAALLDDIVKQSSEANIGGVNVTGGKRIELSSKAKKQIEKNLHKKGSFSIHEIVEEIDNVGALNESIFHWNALFDSIPKIENSSGDMVPMVKLGSHGFNTKTHLGSFDTKGYTIFDLMSPIYIISNDVSIMQQGYKSGQVYRYDAIYGGRSIIDTAREANQFIGSEMLVNFNPFAKIEDSINNYANVFENGLINTQALNEIAKQKLLNNGVTPTNAEIQDIINQYKRFMANPTEKREFLETLNKLKENAISRKEAIEKRVQGGEKIPVNNFQLEHKAGLDKTTYTLKEEDLYTGNLDSRLFDGNRKRFIGRGNKINKDELDRIEPSQDIDSSSILFGYETFPDDGVSTSIDLKLDGNIDTKGSTLRTKQDLNYASSSSAIQTNGVDFIVRISSKNTPEESVPVIFHEVSHIAEDLMTRTDTDAGTNLGESLYTLVSDMRSNIYSQTRSQTGEDLTDFLGMLMQNEIVSRNADKFNAIYGKSSQFINDFIYTHNGTPYSISTIDDLMNIFRKGSPEADTLETYRSNFVSAINQQAIKDAIFFNKARNNINVHTDAQGKLYQAVNKKLEDGTSDLMKQIRILKESELINTFRLDTTKAQVDSALGMATAFEKKALEYMTQAKKEIEKMVSDADISIDRNIDKNQLITSSIMMGMHRVKRILNDTVGLTYSEAKVLSDRELSSLLYDIGKSVGAISKRELESIKNKLDSFASGTYKGGIVDLRVILSDLTKGSKSISTRQLREKVEEYSAFYRFTNKGNEKVYNQIYANNNISKLQTIYTAIQSKRLGNENILFGISPRAELNKYNQSLIFSDSPGSKTVGKVEIMDKDGQYHTKYIETDGTDKVMIGERRSQLISPILSDIQQGKLGRVKVDGKLYSGNKEIYVNESEVYLNFFGLEDRTEFFKMGIDDILLNNAYASTRTEVGTEIFDNMFNALRKSGAIISEDAYESAGGKVKEMFTDVEHDYLNERYGKWYVSDRFAHQVNGTEGEDVRAFFEKHAGSGIAPLLTNTFKVAKAISSITKSWIIKARIKSYINSYAASTFIGISNTSDLKRYIANGFVVNKQLNEAKKLAESIANDKIKLQFAKGKDKNELEKSLKRKTKQMEEQYGDIDYFMNNGGLQTIRSADEEMSKQKEEIANLFSQSKGKPGEGEENFSKNISTVSLNNSTRLGKMVSDFFDKTEVVPKAQFFKTEVSSLRKQGYTLQQSREIAMSKTLTAFPTYNNLNKTLSMLDDVFPFTKYYANIPRIATYAFTNNPTRLGIMLSMLHGGAYASWELSGKEGDASRLYVPGVDISIYTSSFNPFLFDFGDYIKDPFMIDSFKKTVSDPTILGKVWNDVGE